MRLTVLGCSGTCPGAESPCASYLLEADGFRLLLDAGNGSVGALARFADLLAVDAVFVSHLHGDHWLDLVPYAYARRHAGSTPAPRLPVHGPAGTADRLRAQLRGVADEAYDVRRVEAGRAAIGPFEVTFARTAHPVETYGARLTAGGRTLAYSADSGETEALVGLARDADAFLCESSYLDGGNNPPGLHLTGGQAGGYATRAGAGRLILTHIVPWGDPERSLAAASSAYAGPAEIARSGASYDV